MGTFEDRDDGFAYKTYCGMDGFDFSIDSEGDLCFDAEVHEYAFFRYIHKKDIPEFIARLMKLAGIRGLEEMLVELAKEFGIVQFQHSEGMGTLKSWRIMDGQCVGWDGSTPTEAAQAALDALREGGE